MEAESELLSLPSVAMDAVLAFCSYDEISGLRLVCKKMNVICQRVLNQGFLRVERYHAQCQKQVKSQLPRRESERRSHPLARHADILAAVETRLSLLTMTFMKYVDMNLCCFIPGRVIDEIYRVLRYVNGTRTPQRAHEVLQELRDISSMAMEYFDEKIVPGLKKKIGGDMSTRFLSATSVPGPSGALATVQLFSKQSCSKQELNKMQTQLKANSTGLGGLRKELSDLRSKELSELRSKLGELQRQVQEQEQKLLEQSQVMVEQSTRLLEQERKLGQTEAKLTEQHSVQLALSPPPALQPSKGGGGAPSTSTAADAGLAAGVGGRAAGQSAHRRGGRGRGRGGGRGGGGAGGVDRDDGSQPAPPAADRSRSRPSAVAAQGGSAGGSGGRRGSSGSHRKRCLAREAASSSATSASISGDGGCGAANCAAATTTVSVAATAGSASPSATGQALPKRRKMLHGDEEAVGGAARRTTRKAQGVTAAVDSNSSKRQRAKK